MDGLRRPQSRAHPTSNGAKSQLASGAQSNATLFTPDNLEYVWRAAREAHAYRSSAAKTETRRQ